MREAGGQRGSFACAGSCKHQHRAFGRKHGLALWRVQLRGIGWHWRTLLRLR